MVATVTFSFCGWVMPINLSFNFDVQLYGRQLYQIDQFDNSFWHVLDFDAYRFTRLIADWSVETNEALT